MLGEDTVFARYHSMLSAVLSLRGVEGRILRHGLSHYNLGNSCESNGLGECIANALDCRAKAKRIPWEDVTPVIPP